MVSSHAYAAFVQLALGVLLLIGLLPAVAQGKPAWVNVSHYLCRASDYLLLTGRSDVECKWR